MRDYVTTQFRVQALTTRLPSHFLLLFLVCFHVRFHLSGEPLVLPELGLLIV